MIAKLPIEIDGRQYKIVADDEIKEDPCEKCAFLSVEDCPDHICAYIFPKYETYIERV